MTTAPLVALAIALLVGAVLAPMVLTVLGAQRRRTSWPAAVVSGLFFPVTWAVWYRADYQTSPSRQSQAIGASGSMSRPPST